MNMCLVCNGGWESVLWVDVFEHRLMYHVIRHICRTNGTGCPEAFPQMRLCGLVCRLPLRAWRHATQVAVSRVAAGPS